MNNPWNAANAQLAGPPKFAHSKQVSEVTRSQREIDLEMREATLRAKEAQLAEKEQKYGHLQIPNWPRFKPMIYHDIEKDS